MNNNSNNELAAVENEQLANDPEDDIEGLNLQENHTHVVCPVCELDFPQTFEFRNHMLYTHPEFIAIWASTIFGPMFHEDDFLDFYRGILVENDEMTNVDTDNMTYEELLELCEEIGDHKEGVTDVDEAIEIVADMGQITEVKCPICLEEFGAVGTVEKIKSCGHVYCSDCIRKWLAESKRCPVCKGDAS